MPRSQPTVSSQRSISREHSDAKFVWLLVAPLALAACGSPDRLPPNLILLTSDLESSELTCFGGSSGEGEALCGLANAGARCSWKSGDTSTASFIASLMTSRRPSEHDLGRSAATFLPSDVLTVAEILQNAGFRTAAVVTAPELNRSRNFQQGFDSFIDRPSSVSVDERDGSPADAATDAALQWARDARAPWFLWVHYDAELTSVDREVSHLVRGLDDLGVDPGVLFTGTGSRANRAQEAAPIPLLWRAPDKRPVAAGETGCTFETADLAATLLIAADQPIPDGFIGKPLFFADWRRDERRLSANP